MPSEHNFQSFFSAMHAQSIRGSQEKATLSVKKKSTAPAPRLPDEILRKIFMFLPTTAATGDLARVARVNKDWAAAASWW